MGWKWKGKNVNPAGAFQFHRQQHADVTWFTLCVLVITWILMQVFQISWNKTTNIESQGDANQVKDTLHAGLVPLCSKFLEHNLSKILDKKVCRCLYNVIIQRCHEEHSSWHWGLDPDPLDSWNTKPTHVIACIMSPNLIWYALQNVSCMKRCGCGSVSLWNVGLVVWFPAFLSHTSKCPQTRHKSVAACLFKFF